MQKGPTFPNRNSLQLNEIVAGTQRPLLGTQLYLQILRCGRSDTIDKLDGISIFDRLRRFLPDADRHDRFALAGRGMAILGVDRQNQNVAPVLRAVECDTDRVERVADQGIDIAFQVIGRFGRIEDQRLPKWIVLEAFTQGRIFGLE